MIALTTPALGSLTHARFLAIQYAEPNTLNFTVDLGTLDEDGAFVPSDIAQESFTLRDSPAVMDESTDPPTLERAAVTDFTDFMSSSPQEGDDLWSGLKRELYLWLVNTNPGKYDYTGSLV